MTGLCCSCDTPKPLFYRATLIRLRNDNAAVHRLPCHDARSSAVILIHHRNAADRRLELLHSRIASGSSSMMCHHELAAALFGRDLATGSPRPPRWNSPERFVISGALSQSGTDRLACAPSTVGKHSGQCSLERPAPWFRYPGASATILPDCKSRGPSSSTTGTPRRSQWKNFAPGSGLHDRPPWRPLLSRCGGPLPAPGLALRPCDRSAPAPTLTGASLGGSTRPLSSEWLMISPPIRRVLTPQLVCQT